MARTIPTCSLLALLLVPGEVIAKRADTPLGVYVRARVADRANDPAVAIASYATAMTMSADTNVVAFRAYRAGLDGGDYALALRSAQALERADILPADARVLLYIAAARDGDGAAASARLDAIAEQDGFTFLAPLLARWLSPKSAAAPTQPGATAYAAENEALLAIARGMPGRTVAVRALWPTDPYRASTLRLAAAATLSARGAHGDAVALLAGDDASLTAARLRAERRQRLSGAVDTPARGAGFVLARMAADLMSSASARSAITLARLAAFADPDSPQVRIVLATALGVAKRHDPALALFDSLSGDPVYADLAAGLRIDQLEALGRTDEAFAAARLRAARSTNDLTRLGDIDARRGRHAEAATHYAQAVAAVGDDNAGSQLWSALGNALEQSGDWAAARPALERALRLAPDDARLLNQLGYGMADRGENLDRAEALLTRAATAQPDSAAITDSLGWVQFRAGRFSRALTTLERARTLDPVDPEIAEHLGDVYWAVGRRIEARYAWTAARDAADAAAVTRLQRKLVTGRP